MIVRDIIYLNAYPPSRGETRARILREVCEKHGVTLDELRGEARPADVCDARHEAFYRMRVEVNLSYPRIGQVMGGFDHATVIHGIEKHAQLHGLPSTRAVKASAKGQDAT